MKTNAVFRKFVKAASALSLLIFPILCCSAESDFQKAVRTNDLATIDRLAGTIEGIDTRGTNGKTALMIAAKNGGARLVKKLLKAGANSRAVNANGGTPIMFAAIEGNIETMEALIKAGVDISARGSNGWSALMIAAAKGHVEATRLIINKGAEINTTDIYLWTPLHRAAYENRVDVVKLLLEQETIDIHRLDDHGATALHHAAGKGNTDIVDLLIARGADPNKADSDGKTPSNYASNNGYQRLAHMLNETS